MDHRDRIDRFVGEVTDEVRYVSEDSDADFLLFNDQATDIVDEIHEEPILPNDTLFAGDTRPDYADEYVEFRDSASADPVDIVPSRTFSRTGPVSTTGNAQQAPEYVNW
jgi:hypothetical protein